MRVPFPFIALVLAAGCHRNITEGGAELRILRGVVYGNVSAQTGAGVSGVGIDLRPDPNGGCPAQDELSPNVATVQAVTGADGAFRAEVFLAVGTEISVQSSCVRLDIAPTPSAGLRDTSVSVGPVQFMRTVSDSVHAGIVLRTG
jgi:hypothetical protein